MVYIYINMILDDEFSHELLRISGDIHKKIELDDMFSKLPDQLLFTLNRDTQQCEYHFVYHLMGQIPEDNFNKSLLNNALKYHGEKPLD